MRFGTVPMVQSWLTLNDLSTMESVRGVLTNEEYDTGLEPIAASRW